MISYKTVHQTDKTRDSADAAGRPWLKLNARDGWRLNFLDDDEAFEWVADRFEGSDVEWAWRYMHRGVLRADFLRYLLPLIEGGVYSDVDVSDPTHPHRGAEACRETGRSGISGSAVRTR
jgi:alpha 1,6-mannosyltransferase